MFFKRLFCMIVLLAALAYGYSEPQRTAMGSVPNACPQFDCRTIHAYWNTNESAGVVFAHHEAGKEDNSNAFMYWIFTDTSTEKQGYTGPYGAYDKWAWTACTPTCGKSVAFGTNPPLTTWQSPQMVTRSGTGKALSGYLNEARYVCEAAEGGNGPSTTPGSNNNDQDRTPPGN